MNRKIFIKIKESKKLTHSNNCCMNTTKINFISSSFRTPRIYKYLFHLGIVLYKENSIELCNFISMMRV